MSQRHHENIPQRQGPTAFEGSPRSEGPRDFEGAADHNGKLYIETVGCQMNMLDSELVVAALRKRGYELTPHISEADTLLFNTCSVREHAEHKIYSQLGRVKHSKRPRQVIGVLGCMAQKDQALIFRRAPHVDLVVGTGQLAEIPRLLDEARQRRFQSHRQSSGNREPLMAVSLSRRDGSRQQVSGSFQSYDPLREPEMRPSPYQAFVRIMIGCDKFCAYCVVPATRGPEQSRSPYEIAHEVRVLAGQGVKEVTLLGQTVNSYKHTAEGRLFRLSDLLELIHDTHGIERIKFVTNYPRDMSNDLLEAVRDLPKVAHYLHVPAQSGCNHVLRMMKRGYTVEQYLEMLDRIREIVPECAVSSDFIVGHPGETDESFQLSMDLIRRCRFKNSFIFKYSPRPGTKGDALYPDEIPEEVKRRRNNEMLDLQNEISEEDNAQFIGRQVEVLVEGPSKAALKSAKRGKDAAPQAGTVPAVATPGTKIALARPQTSPTAILAAPKSQLVGRTTCDRIVVFDGNLRLAGSLTHVAVSESTCTTLIGSIVTHEYQHGLSELLPILQ